MELSRQRDLAVSFYTWFDSGLKQVIEDNRRRYRMELKDAQDRIDHRLSVLPSTKSTSVVDGAVERALIEYHQDPEALSYTAKAKGDLQKDADTRWLTEIVRYRMKRTFRFFTWHKKSLKSGFTDGIEAAMLAWRHETKPKKSVNYYYTDELGQTTVVDKAQYDKFATLFPGYVKDEVTEDVVVRDTWWIHHLMPGRDILWDPKAPLLDINLGQFAIVKLRFSLADVKNQIKSGVFDKISDEKLKTFQTTEIDPHADQGTFSTNPDRIDVPNLNLIEIWAFFDKEDNDWGVQFSIEGKEALSSRKPVNDVFFNGREVNCLPIALGYSDDELWENVGRGLPKVIAPLEDEATDHRNNYNDYAKQILRGRHWVNPDSDVDIDQLVNMPVVYGREGQDFGQLKLPEGSMDVLRATDSISQEMNSLVPVEINGMGGRVAPKGMNATLGTVQMSQSQADGKMGVRLMTRNETFMNQVMYLIGQLEFAWETDETIARYAASQVKMPPLPNGTPLAYNPPADGGRIDFRRLDFDFDVQINAGLGAVPLQQKAQTLTQLGEYRKAHGVPTDFMEIARQLNVLAGFEPDSFAPKGPPEPEKPVVDYKATINIDLANLLMLEPQAAAFLLQLMMQGGMSVDAKISDKKPNAEAQQNGGGMYQPDRRGDHVSGTDEAAQGMSEGGQQS